MTTINEARANVASRVATGGRKSKLITRASDVRTSNCVDIVMVDDDIDDIYVTQRRLKNSRIANHFLYETDSTRAIETLSNLNLARHGSLNALILLDINMPKVDGFELLQSLKSHPDYRDVPVIMLCNSDDVVDMLDSYSEGADGYLIKPIVTDEMLGFISLLGTHKNHITH